MLLPPLLRRRLLPQHHRDWLWLLHQPHRSFVDARIPWVRDRALDHAVEKERHLHPFLSLKDLLVSSTTTFADDTSAGISIPLSSIAARRADLRLPFRAIRFIRLFPSAFVEDLPSPPSPPIPMIRPTPDLLRLHTDELCAHGSTAASTADRLLRLLMLSPRRRLPLPLLYRLRLDLGLPYDFARSLLPQFPDYFQLSPSLFPSSDLDLELVLYRKDLAVSSMERRAIKTGGYKKGDRLAFPLSFPRGFEMEKKVRKWVDEWQQLPYISPYEDASHLAPKSDLYEKWTVAMVHEILELMVPKKTEKENLELLAEHVGLRSGFKKVITHHPGVFYVSNKLRTQTVVLREAYRRNLLVEKHPLMGLRYHYIHLMHKGRDTNAGQKDRKSDRSMRRAIENRKGKQEEGNGEYEDDEDEDEEEEDEVEEEFLGVSDAESDGESDDVDSNDQHNSTGDRNSPRQREFCQPIESSRARPIERRLRTGLTNQVAASRKREMHREPNIRMTSRGRVSSNKKKAFA